MTGYQNKVVPEWAVIALGSIIIVLLGLYMTSGISEFMDIQLSDESKYLYGGMHFFERIPKGWGPSYSAWYKALHLIQPDPIKLHYLNFKVLAIGMSVLIFFLLYRMKVPAVLAFFGGVCFLFADLNIETWPRISHFAAATLLIAFIISTYLRSTYLKILLFTMTALGISYARPEMGLSFSILLAVLVGYVLWKRFRLARRDYLITLALLPVVAILFMKLGVPILKSQSQPDIASGNYPRSVTAYGQHFYLNYTEWNKMEEQNLFLWDIGFKEYYEIEPSLLKTLRSNIPITIKHVSVNTWNYIRKSFDYVSGVFLPDKILHFPVWLKFILFVSSIGIILWLIGLSEYLQNIKAHLKKYATEYLLILILTIPPMISSTLIYPREHYLMLQIPFFFLIVTPILLIHFKKNFNRQRAFIIIFLLGALLAILMPTGKEFDHFAVWQDRTGPVNLSAINTINELQTTTPYTIILNEGNIDTYISNPGVVSLVGYAQLKGNTFEQAVETFNVKMVYVTSLMEDDPFYQADETWMRFLGDPSILSFKRIDLETTFSYLLVDETLLAKKQN